MNPLSRTPVPGFLKWCLHLLVVGLLAVAAGRAVTGDAAHPAATAAAAALVAAVYALGPVLPAVERSLPATAAWLCGVGAAWLALTALTADGVWVAFPFYFLLLHLLPPRPALGAVLATALAAAAGYAWHHGGPSLASFLGPLIGAAVAAATVLGYQALYRESEQRRRLIQELTEARAELEEAGRTAGAMAERERLAREIHDTLAQGLTSIQLLLRAAERALPEGASAGRYVAQARKAAVDNLAEARRFVHALTPPDLSGEEASLRVALERLCDTTSLRHGLPVRFHISGTQRTLPRPHEVALLRIAQSSLANAVAHAEAAAAEVTLSYMPDRVALDVVDDGHGFDPGALPPPEPGHGGFGLAAMRARARALGGTLTVESSQGRGAAVAVQLPVPTGTSEAAAARYGDEGNTP
nr:histidine kinase [Streptomyces xiaopingdaonensis]